MKLRADRADRVFLMVDIVLRAVVNGKDVEYSKARYVMTNDTFWCYEDQTSDEVADYMAEKEIRRVLILNRKNRLVGVISIGIWQKQARSRSREKRLKTSQRPRRRKPPE